MTEKSLMYYIYDICAYWLFFISYPNNTVLTSVKDYQRCRWFGQFLLYKYINSGDVGQIEEIGCSELRKIKQWLKINYSHMTIFDIRISSVSLMIGLRKHQLCHVNFYPSESSNTGSCNFKIWIYDNDILIWRRNEKWNMYYNTEKYI